MPFVRSFAAFAVAAILALPLLLSNLPAQAAQRVPHSMAVVMSMFDGRTMIVSGNDLLAVAPLPESMAQARRHWRTGGYYGRPDPYYGCGYYQRCRDPYGHPAAFYEGPPEIILAGRDLQLTSIGAPVLASASTAKDDDRDHWRILLEHSGKLESNPSADISTAALLAPLKNVDPVTTASAAAPVRIEITRRNGRMQTADVQKLLTRLGHDTGPADGLAGPVTRAAVRGFQTKRGIEETGEITPALVEAIYLAAGEEKPMSGKLVIRRGNKKVVEADIEIDRPQASLGTHVLMLDKSDKQWRLLTLSGRLSDQAHAVFNFPKKDQHAAAARDAMERIHVPTEIRAQLLQVAGPGSVMVVSDETATVKRRRFREPVWR